MAKSLPKIEEILGEFDAGIFMQKVDESLNFCRVHRVAKIKYYMENL